ncbi:MAG: hypothetical protein JO041_09080, partial [Acidobacteria bacterium]|nr:hypothetical protein [Acidobacteriota bacterium]
MFGDRQVRSTAKLFAYAALLLCSAASWAAAGNKKNAKTEAPQLPPRLAFDIRNIVWPNPPAIARIRFQDMLTGEKIDWTAIDAQAKTKPKKSWMDRLAGTDAASSGPKIKIPYQLVRPYGIAVDAKGNIYTADEGVDAIFIFNAETKAVEFIRNDIEAHFGLINGLAIDDDDRLFVSDGRLHKILVFDPQHQLKGSFGAETLNLPGGIALDRENRLLYVVDTGNDQVVAFDADKFTVVRKIGVAGKKHTLTEPGTFSLPSQVAVDKDGDLYIT